jgi:hypothetical protein
VGSIGIHPAVFEREKQKELQTHEFAGTGEQAIEQIKLVRDLEERFDAEMKDRNKSDEDEEPGIGNRG